MGYKPINTSDRISSQASFMEQTVQLGKFQVGFWGGFALLKAGQSYSSVDIIFSSQHRGTPNKTSALIYANTRIQSVGFINRGEITLGAATGKIKLAPALDTSNAALFVESAAASSNVLAVPNTAVETLNWDTAVDVGGSDITYKLFATDGAAGAGATASTMTVTKDTYIDVEIGFIAAVDFGSRERFGVLAPTN